MKVCIFTMPSFSNFIGICEEYNYDKNTCIVSICRDDKSMYCVNGVNIYKIQRKELIDFIRKNEFEKIRFDKKGIVNYLIKSIKNRI
ncbi:MAG TPA: hypothetical protein VLM81_01325 [Peptostreptococcaceae bacterium]|nr:hypothetical protein [Peptostreptococcaceae bacterium]